MILVPQMIVTTRAETLEGFVLRLYGRDLSNSHMGMAGLNIYVDGEVEVELIIRQTACNLKREGT